MALFDDKERKAVKTGIGHCTKCSQILDVLRTIGAPNEQLEEQNGTNQKILEKALEIDEQHSRQSKG